MVAQREARVLLFRLGEERGRGERGVHSKRGKGLAEVWKVWMTQETSSAYLHLSQYLPSFIKVKGHSFTKLPGLSARVLLCLVGQVYTPVSLHQADPGNLGRTRWPSLLQLPSAS